jgi:hypothetical protein
MLNPLASFKKSLLVDVNVMGKTFTFDTSKPLKTLNKVDILVNILVAVEKVNLEDFSSIKEGLDKGLTLEEAKKQEIESWEPEIIGILRQKYINILKNKKPIDFKNLPDLRIYWKLRKIFSKEEIDSWADIDWQWAIYNLQEDLNEAEEADDRNLEKRKAWMNFDLYKYLNKKEQEKQQTEQDNKLLVQKLMEQQGLDSDKYQIEFVEEEFPSIIEEGPEDK